MAAKALLNPASLLYSSCLIDKELMSLKYSLRLKVHKCVIVEITEQS